MKENKNDRVVHFANGRPRRDGPESGAHQVRTGGPSQVAGRTFSGRKKEKEKEKPQQVEPVRGGEPGRTPRPGCVKRGVATGHFVISHDVPF